MSNTTTNQLTLSEKFDSILSDYISNETEYINEHDAIKAILQPLEGKPIDGRTLNKKVLGDFKFTHEYSMYYITGKHQHLIGYSSSENRIAIDKTDYSRGFDYFDNCHGNAARERIAQIKALDKEKAKALFCQIESHFNALRQLFGDVEREKLGSYHFPAYYDVLRAIYSDEKERDNVKLTDFYYIRK